MKAGLHGGTMGVGGVRLKKRGKINNTGSKIRPYLLKNMIYVNEV